MTLLPSSDAAYLRQKGILYDEVVEGPNKAVILRSYGLPAAHFDCSRADILILLPAGYPDVAPDMFYVLPWVKLVNVNRYPNKADQPFPFNGQTWQRWSRHNNEWRPGKDGIWTMLKRIDTALLVAAA